MSKMTMSKQTMSKQTMTMQTMSKQTIFKQTVSKQTMSTQTSKIQSTFMLRQATAMGNIQYLTGTSVTQSVTVSDKSKISRFLDYF